MITVYKVIVDNKVRFESILKDEIDNYCAGVYANTGSDIMIEEYDREPVDHRKSKQ